MPQPANRQTLAARTVSQGEGGERTERTVSYKNEIAEFCTAVRTGAPVRCGGEKAMKSAVAILIGNQAADKRSRLEIPGSNTSA